MPQSSMVFSARLWAWMVVVVCLAGVSAGHEEHLRCRYCGFALAHKSDLTDKPSDKVFYQTTREVLGSTWPAYAFQNPQGHVHEVLLVSDGRVQPYGGQHAEATWFTGYSWSAAYCRQCGKFVGWQFTRDHDHQHTHHHEHEYHEEQCGGDGGSCTDVFTALIVDAIHYKDLQEQQAQAGRKPRLFQM